MSFYKVAMFVAFSYVLGLLTGLLVTMVSTNPSTVEDVAKKEVVVEEAPSVRDQSFLQYKNGKCLVINRFKCPPGWGPGAANLCEEDLEACAEKYDSLQKFCNIQCEEELEFCQIDLQKTKDSCFYDSLYFKIGNSI